MYCIVDTTLEIDKTRTKILKSTLPKDSQYKLLIDIENKVHQIIIELLQHPSLKISFTLTKTLAPLLNELLENTDKTTLKKDKSVPKPLQEDLHKFDIATQLPDYLLLKTYLTPQATSHLLTTIDSSLKLDWIKHQLSSLPLSSSWELTHREHIRLKLRLATIEILKHLLKTTSQASLLTKSTTQLTTLLTDTYDGYYKEYIEMMTQLEGSMQINLTSIAVITNKLELFPSK